jgi:hypothetical protein
MPCTLECWSKLGAIVSTIYAAVTFALLVTYSRYELDNHHIVNVDNISDWNNGVAVIMMNVGNLASLILITRALLQVAYVPQSGDQAKDDYAGCLWFLVMWLQIGTVIVAFIAFGKNCHSPLPCYTIISPLYLMVVIYLHIGFAAVALVVVAAVLWLLTAGLWELCRCWDLFPKKQDAVKPVTYNSVDVIIQKPNLANVDMTYANISNIRARTEEKACSICSQNYNPTDVVELMKNCSHYFHKLCIEAWFVKNPSCTCPVCNTENK